MAVTSAAGAQSVGGGLWVQIQLQQARQNADRAEQQAAALQAKAQSAQSVADRAQENARSLQVASRQAQGEAAQARQNLATRSSVGEGASRVGDSEAQIGKVLQSNTVKAGSITAISESSAPVLNAAGQQTGTLVNVTA